MSRPRLSLLDAADVARVHATSLRILGEVGVHVPHAETLDRLEGVGAQVDRDRRIARLPETVVEAAIAGACKQYVLYGRDASRVARYGYGDANLMSTPGQFAWFDVGSPARRDPVLGDARAAITVADALANVTVVGAMAVPFDVPNPVRDVVLTAALVRGTGKPTRAWPVTRASSEFVLRIYEALAGGRDALRARPMIETFLEPISPLRFPETGLDVMVPFIERGQPVSIGPMVMASGTGPATLAGTLAQENAEILAGVVMVQSYAPGHPVMYGGIPHVMDPRTSICAFGSPEQGLMAIAMTEIGRSYGFPVYVNVNLTDAKQLDAQAGFEKAASLLPALIAGADTFGHAGIVGTDHGAGLDWLVVDDEAMAYALRMARGIEVDEETLAYEVIADVGSTGDFLSEDHTVRHFRRELFAPSARWTREPYERWRQGGLRSMGDRAGDRVAEILATHRPTPLDADLDLEVEAIVGAAAAELVN